VSHNIQQPCPTTFSSLVLTLQPCPTAFSPTTFSSLVPQHSAALSHNIQQPCPTTFSSLVPQHSAALSHNIQQPCPTTFSSLVLNIQQTVSTLCGLFPALQLCPQKFAYQTSFPKPCPQQSATLLLAINSFFIATNLSN